MFKRIILVYIRVKFYKYKFLFLFKFNKIFIKLKGLDFYFLKLNYIKLNYLFNLFNIKIFLFKILKRGIVTLNSSHISNIKSKEQFSSVVIKMNYFFNKCCFFLNFLNYKLFNFLFLNIVSVSFKDVSQVIYFIKD